MPTRAPRLCLVSTCSQPVYTGGYCSVHRPCEQDRPNVDVRKLYRQSRWRHLRADVLAADPLCADCQRARRLRLATEVHHRHRHGGDLEKFYDRAGLEGLCRSCHQHKTGRGE
jgi:5-methylcytosine-specific restriction protein A